MKTNIKYSFYYSQTLFIVLLPFWIKLTNYLHPIVFAVVWLAITILVFFSVFLIKKEKMRLPKHFLHLFVFLYTIGLLTLLFFRPKNQSYNTFNLIPFDTIHFYFSGRVNIFIAFYNLVGNIGLFIPFGLYYCYLKKQVSSLRSKPVSIYLLNNLFIFNTS